MHYTGETLLPGLLGQFFIILSLVASFVASFAYFKTVQAKIETDAAGWKKLARIAFITEAFSVFAIFGILFYIINNHLFEYKYAWQHSNRSLEAKYLLSCFWEGQEGSFLLWSTWHCVLGLILIRRAKKWEAPVMSVVSFAQFCLATMIVGFYFFDQKVGTNPFVLMRNEGMLDNAPMFLDANGAIRADYLNSLTDGRGLNQLLQNYWMVIHPPVLFMGFASTLVPFAYAIGGLWTKQHDWIKPALSWSLFSAAILGTGIMMGGAWAYESLNFGGYWAWDPVENASLVPWLTLIAGIHTLLIYKHTGRSLKASYIFFILTFLLVLYSTFLTRSGILGETSVHAFTDLGMNLQLYALLFVFVWMAALAAAKNSSQRLLTAAAALLTAGLAPFSSIMTLISIFAGLILSSVFIGNNIPSEHKEEEKTTSREFWMFIGSLVFFLCALFITIGTSLPVFNKFFNTKFTMGADPVHAYNRVIIFVGIIIGVLTAITQYFKYKQTDSKFVWKKLAIPTIISVLVSAAVLAFGDINYADHGAGFLGAIWVAVACSIYAVIANFSYIWIGMKGKFSKAGASIAHLGFGLMLVGILLSSSKKEVLSYNTSGIFVPLGKDSKEKPGENLTLLKGVPTTMGNYTVTYVSDSVHPNKPLWFYRLEFHDKKSGKKEFTLTPNAFINYQGNEGLSANPDAKHYWDHDIFTYITSLPDPEKTRDTTSFQPVSLKIGDTTSYANGFAFYVLQGVQTVDNIPTGGMGPDDKAYIATIKIYSKDTTSYTAKPTLISKGGQLYPITDTVVSENLIFSLNNVQGNTVQLGVKETRNVSSYITLKAYKFPGINLVWLGTIVMVIGLVMSMIYRIRQNRSKKSQDLSF